MSDTKQFGFRAPKIPKTAIQLSEMPLSEMLAQIERQEEYAGWMSTMGERAANALCRLCAGDRITFGPQADSKRKRYHIGADPIDADVVAQLKRRGFIWEIPE